MKKHKNFIKHPITSEFSEICKTLTGAFPWMQSEISFGLEILLGQPDLNIYLCVLVRHTITPSHDVKPADLLQPEAKFF